MISFKKRTEYLFLYKYGRKYYPCPWLIINYKKNDIKTLRLGLTLPAKVGNAVVRNKLKRWSRSYFCNKEKSETQIIHYDLNLNFKPMNKGFYKNLNYEEFVNVIEKSINKIITK